MTATIHLMHGFIGFGKTTIAKQLAHDLPAVRFSNDEWMIALYGRGPHGEENHSKYWQNINKLQWSIIEQIVRAGGDVIIDDGHWGRDWRKSDAERALKFADRVVFHNVKCDINTARARCVARTNSDENELFICENTFDLLLLKFEPISDDEGFEVITYESVAKNKSQNTGKFR